MRFQTIAAPERAASTALVLRANSLPASIKTDDSANLLQRTQVLLQAAPPDPRYWTAYDYFMLEREARALRRAHLGNLIRAAWQRWRGAAAAQTVKPGALPR